VSGSADQTLAIWRENGSLARRIYTAHTIFDAQFVPDSHNDRKLLSNASNHTILLHDVEHITKQMASGVGIDRERSVHAYLQVFKGKIYFFKHIKATNKVRLFKYKNQI
jgi:hypothetical protein